MPTIEKRILALEARLAAYKQRLDNLPMAQRLTAKIEAGQAEIAKMKDGNAKKAADQQRRDDTHAKIIIGGAVLLLSSSRLFQLMFELIAMLKARDRKWLQTWSLGRGISLERVDGNRQLSILESDSADESGELKTPALSSVIASSSENKLLPLVLTPTPNAVFDPKSDDPALQKQAAISDPVGSALKRAVERLGEGDITLFLPEILKNASSDDRNILEQWSASLTRDRKLSAEVVKTSDTGSQAN